MSATCRDGSVKRMNDAAMLTAIPEFITLDAPFLKATPAEEGGERMLYMEASNEDQDFENEIVLQKALEASADYFIRHGNIDLSHYSILGPKSGIPNYLEYEIGKPVNARVDGKETYVQAQLYKGDSAMARNANMVWDSLTKQSPPARWYPSVGGKVLAKSIRIDPDTKAKVGVVESVLWSNIALDRMPINRTVPEISTLPIGVFAKSFGGFVLAKALEAGTATDVATLTGGGALAKQSLDRKIYSYWDFREALSKALRKKRVKPGLQAMQRFATSLGLDSDSASEFVERFFHDIQQQRGAL